MSLNYRFIAIPPEDTITYLLTGYASVVSCLTRGDTRTVALYYSDGTLKDIERQALPTGIYVKLRQNSAENATRILLPLTQRSGILSLQIQQRRLTFWVGKTSSLENPYKQLRQSSCFISHEAFPTVTPTMLLWDIQRYLSLSLPQKTLSTALSPYRLPQIGAFCAQLQKDSPQNALILWIAQQAQVQRETTTPQRLFVPSFADNDDTFTPPTTTPQKRAPVDHQEICRLLAQTANAIWTKWEAHIAKAKTTGIQPKAFHNFFQACMQADATLFSKYGVAVPEHALVCAADDPMTQSVFLQIVLSRYAVPPLDLANTPAQQIRPLLQQPPRIATAREVPHTPLSPSLNQCSDWLKQLAPPKKGGFSLSQRDFGSIQRDAKIFFNIDSDKGRTLEDSAKNLHAAIRDYHHHLSENHDLRFRQDCLYLEIQHGQLAQALLQSEILAFQDFQSHFQQGPPPRRPTRPESSPHNSAQAALSAGTPFSFETLQLLLKSSDTDQKRQGISILEGITAITSTVAEKKSLYTRFRTAFEHLLSDKDETVVETTKKTLHHLINPALNTTQTANRSVSATIDPKVIDVLKKTAHFLAENHPDQLLTKCKNLDLDTCHAILALQNTEGISVTEILAVQHPSKLWALLTTFPYDQKCAVLTVTNRSGDTTIDLFAQVSEQFLNIALAWMDSLNQKQQDHFLQLPFGINGKLAHRMADLKPKPLLAYLSRWTVQDQLQLLSLPDRDMSPVAYLLVSQPNNGLCQHIRRWSPQDQITCLTLAGLNTDISPNALPSLVLYTLLDNNPEEIYSILKELPKADLIRLLDSQTGELSVKDFLRTKNNPHLNKLLETHA